MTGLDLRNVHLRSTDTGKTWQQVSADAFQSCMNGITGEAQTALADGTILRGVWGYYLPYNPELPKTGYLQRSADGSKTWGKPEVLLDPEKYSAWPKRLRVLRDGRLIVLGGVACVPANSPRAVPHRAAGRDDLHHRALAGAGCAQQVGLHLRLPPSLH
jgi:hypothetical protein